jgi:uncharacterized membrane protein YgcG
MRAAAFNQGEFPTIAFVNLATVSLGVDLDKLVAALAKQLQQDFVPIWGYPAKLYVTQNPKPGEWQVVFLNDADAAKALGYHDLTKNGQPISKVFVRTTLSAGEKVSVTASHELLEMLIDPGAQMWAQSGDGKFYAYEMCDAVEAEEYVIDGVAVSDFVYPSFFESWHKPGSVQFDHLKRVSRPFETLKQGYQIVSNGKSSTEIFGSRGKERHFRLHEVRTMHRSEYRKAIQARKANGRELAVLAPQPPIRVANLVRAQHGRPQIQADAAGAPAVGAPIVLQHLGNLLVSVAQFTAGAETRPQPSARRFVRRRARPRLLAQAAPAAAAGDTGTSPDGDRYVVYDGGLNVGGDRNWRNNNPGNIEYGQFAKDNGAIGSDGRFAIFPDAETGREALTSLMEGRYGESSIGEMMQAYAPSNENDTDHYIDFIEQQTGLSRDDVVGDLSEEELGALADAINTMEGGHEGETYQAGDSDNPDWVDGVIGSDDSDSGDATDETGDNPDDQSDDPSNDTTGPDQGADDSNADDSSDDNGSTSSSDEGDGGDTGSGDDSGGGDSGGGGDDGGGDGGDGGDGEDGGGLGRRVRAPRVLPPSDGRRVQVARRT